MKKSAVIFAVLSLVALATTAAFAFSTPGTADFAYDLYDIAVNDIFQGPIGFVGGVVCIIMGAIAAIQAKLMLAIPAILGGAALLKAKSIVTSMGATI